MQNEALKKPVLAVQERCHVAIVGGGMVGLSLAYMFACQHPSWHIALIDSHAFSANSGQQKQTSFDQRTTALSAGSVRLLDQLQLWPRLKLHAQAINHVHVSDKGHVGFTEYTREQNQGEALGWVIDNAQLGAELVKVVQGCTSIRRIAPAQVKRIRMQAKGALLELESKEHEQVRSFELASELLVLADGAESPLARSLGIHFNEYAYNQHALVANVVHSKPHQGQAFERFTASGPLAFLPRPDFQGQPQSALVWTQASENIDAYLHGDEAEFLAQLHTQFGYALGEFRQVSTRSAYPLRLVSAQEQARSSVVLMGNAAHFLHPVAGQGFNLALRDCAVLADVLANKSEAQRNTSSNYLGDIKTLQRYLDRRQRDQYLTTELSHRFVSAFTSKQGLVKAARNIGLWGIHQTPALKTLFFHQMMGLNEPGVCLK